MAKDFDEILRKAAEMVEGLPEDLRSEAFKEAVDYLKAERGSEEAISTSSVVDNSVADGQPDGFLGKLSSEVDIPSEQLAIIYELKGRDLRINAPFEGQNLAKSQRLLAYIYILGAMITFDAEWVSSSDLAREASRHGLNDGHISGNIDSEKTFIQSTGTRRGKKYRLTPAGVRRAVEILRGTIHVE